MSWHLHCSTCTLTQSSTWNWRSTGVREEEYCTNLRQIKLMGNRGFSCGTQLSHLEYADDMHDPGDCLVGGLEGHAAITG